MYQEDYMYSADQNAFDNQMTQEKLLEQTKMSDRGYNIVYRKVERKDGKLKNKKIEVYSTGGMGSRIRDAETGDYFPNIVGSKDEDLFFKVGLSTGECKSANGSSTLFYLSPEHYMNHLHGEVHPDTIVSWEQKRENRLAELKSEKTKL